jgi:hypothetical protein
MVTITVRSALVEYIWGVSNDDGLAAFSPRQNYNHWSPRLAGPEE